MQKHLDWQHMAYNVYILLHKFRTRTHGGSQVEHKQRLQPFPAAGPLECMTIDILGSLPRITTVIKLSLYKKLSSQK